MEKYIHRENLALLRKRLAESHVNKRPRLPPSSLCRSIAWLAYRRRDPTPTNTMPAASNGVLAGNAGWGCECPHHGYLFFAWGQTGGIRSRLALFARPAPPACGLDRLTPARQGLAMQVRQEVSRRMQAFLRRKSMTRTSDFRRGIPGRFYPMNSDEGASAWQRKRNGRGLVRPTTTDRSAASPSIPAFGGLPKPSADSLRARRISLRPPPMTMNYGGDSNVGNGCPKLGWVFLNRLRVHPV
jgi:hypothetical protein